MNILENDFQRIISKNQNKTKKIFKNGRKNRKYLFLGIGYSRENCSYGNQQSIRSLPSDFLNRNFATHHTARKIIQSIRLKLFTAVRATLTS